MSYAEFLANLLISLLSVLKEEACHIGGKPETLIAGLTMPDTLSEQFQEQVNKIIEIRKPEEHL